MRFLFMFLIALMIYTPVNAEETNALGMEETLEAEYNQKVLLVNEMFQKKVEKIRQKDVLPERIRNMLIKQADEIRAADINTLEAKKLLKLRHAKERDAMREELRKEAQERVKWILENEEEFQQEKAERSASEVEPSGK
ncbi:MAG: hypothetical protein MJ247_03660 [Alphaproteobacteria bacterium]|nr:hypothetical protein [Alphaproteobacteria bacterium]